MNSYKKLINNSIIFAIGTLGSKLISFLLVPLYTYYLSTTEYGTVDLTITTVQLLLPIVSASMYEAVLRFTMDKEEEPENVLTNAVTIALSGFMISLLLSPILIYFNVLKGNLIYLYIILFVQMIQQILAQYTRALGKIKIFSFNGILLTFTTGIFNIVFLVNFEMGVTGYYLAMILSYAISAIYLLIFTKSYQDLRLTNINKNIMRDLIFYSVPMIPNSLMWWLINASSRYFIRIFVSVSANGLFAVASRIPSLLNIFYQIFNQAWQLSAIEEYDNEDKSIFYSNVFNNLSSFMLLGSSGIIIFIKYIFDILFAPEYFLAWRVVPFLLLGAVFSSFASFLGSNYIAAKQTKGVFKTSIYGGIASLILNTIFIPTIGILGAGISSAVSFLIMFLFRYYDTKKYIKLEVNWGVLVFNVVIILIQTGLLLIGLNQNVELFFSLILFLILLIANKKLISSLLKIVKSILKK